MKLSIVDPECPIQIAKMALTGAGGGIRTHAMPGWKPGAFPLGDARLKNGPGSGSRTHDRAIIDRVLCQLSYPWINAFELVPGAGVEPA